MRITTELALRLPRYHFIAMFLVVATRSGQYRPGGYHVRFDRGIWSVVRSNIPGVDGQQTVLSTRSVEILVEFARRRALCALTLEADDWRTMAIDRAQRAAQTSFAVSAAPAESMDEFEERPTRLRAPVIIRRLRRDGSIDEVA